jgi:hypothetical protein
MSSILNARGAPAKLIDWLTRAEDYFQLLVSQPIWDEYSSVAAKKTQCCRLVVRIPDILKKNQTGAWPVSTVPTKSLQDLC